MRRREHRSFNAWAKDGFAERLRRYQARSTIITNRAFKEWHEVFPNAVSLIDRLVHRCEIVMLQGESYRLKEAMARSEQKGVERAARAARRPSAAKGKKS